MNDPQRSVLWPALRRFWLVALVTAVASGVSAMLLVEATSTPSAVAEASYVVPVAPPAVPLLPGQAPPPPSTLPTSPGAAADYAEVYAVLLREDAAVLRTLAEAAGLEPIEVRERLQALVVRGGSVVRVSVTADTPEQAEAMLAALDSFLTSPTAETPNIPPGNLLPLNRGRVVVSDGLAPLAPVVGGLVGLMLGVGAAVVLERADTRFRSGADVRALVSWPVLPVSDAPGDPRSEVLVERVRRGSPQVRTAALVAPRGTHTAELDSLAGALADAEAGQPHPLTWSVAGVLRGDGGAEQLAQEADAIVLVIPAAARMRHVSQAVQAVEDLAVDPVVVATTPRRGRGGAAAGRRAEHGTSYDDWEDPAVERERRAAGSTQAGSAYAPASRDEETWPPRDTLSGSR